MDIKETGKKLKPFAPVLSVALGYGVRGRLFKWI